MLWASNSARRSPTRRASSPARALVDGIGSDQALERSQLTLHVICDTALHCNTLEVLDSLTAEVPALLVDPLLEYRRTCRYAGEQFALAAVERVQQGPGRPVPDQRVELRNVTGGRLAVEPYTARQQSSARALRVAMPISRPPTDLTRSPPDQLDQQICHA